MSIISAERDLVSHQYSIYETRYQSERRVHMSTYPLDFLDVRLHSIWDLLPDQPSILDVGCGSGQLLLRQRPLQPLSYVGADIAGAGLLRARELVEPHYDANFVQASADILPFDNSCFDAVFAISVIEHLPEPVRFVTEIARVLRPGGFAILHTPNRNDRFTADGFLRRFRPDMYAQRNAEAGHDHGRYLTPDELQNLLFKSSLVVDRIQYTDTLLEWLWVNVIWPKALQVAQSAPKPATPSGPSDLVSVATATMERAVRLYNAAVFPLVRILCAPDRLIDFTKNSGGYIIIARKAKPNK